MKEYYMANRVTLPLERSANVAIVPLNYLLAANEAKSSDQTRYYLLGPFLSHENQEVVATDGQIAVKITLDDEISFIGEGFDEPIKFDSGEKCFKAKSHSELYAHIDLETRLISVVNSDGIRKGVCQFETIDGSFPNYTRLFADLLDQGGINGMKLDFNLLAKLAKSFKHVSDIKSLPMQFFGETARDPIMVKTSVCPQLEAIVMPLRK